MKKTGDRMRYIRLCLLVLGAILPTVPALSAEASGAAPAAPKAAVVSGDELTGRVRALVERQPRFVEMAGRGRVVFVGVDVQRLKPAKESGPIAIEAVLKASAPVIYRAMHYRYADNVTVYSTVDLARNSVSDVLEARNVPTPLAAEELAEARALALSNPEVRKAIGDRAASMKAEALVLRARNPKDSIFGHRAVSVLLLDGHKYVANIRVAVDLTAKTVEVTRMRSGPSHKEMPR